MVAEDGRSFYAECTDYDKEQVDGWIQENVIAHLLYRFESSVDTWHTDEAITLYRSFAATTAQVGAALRVWLEQFDHVEMWSDCLAYDWVLFCELFGGAFGIPKHIYYIPFDLCTLFKIKGIDPDVSREAFAGIDGAKHNALHDALVIKACYEKAVQL